MAADASIFCQQAIRREQEFGVRVGRGNGTVAPRPRCRCPPDLDVVSNTAARDPGAASHATAGRPAGLLVIHPPFHSPAVHCNRKAEFFTICQTASQMWERGGMTGECANKPRPPVVPPAPTSAGSTGAGAVPVLVPSLCWCRPCAGAVPVLVPSLCWCRPCAGAVPVLVPSLCWCRPCAGAVPVLVPSLCWCRPCAGAVPVLVPSLCWCRPCAGAVPVLVPSLCWCRPCAGAVPVLVPSLCWCRPCAGAVPVLVPSLCWCRPCAGAVPVLVPVSPRAWRLPESSKSAKSKTLTTPVPGAPRKPTSLNASCWSAADLVDLITSRTLMYRSGDACRTLPRRSDCACLEDHTRKARSRANQPPTMRKAADLPEVKTSYRSGRNLLTGLIDAARSGSRRMPRDD